VVIIAGGTGSGKSTQCPQYVLEDAIMCGMGLETRIVATQPRRIAATSIAHCIANERNKGEGGGNVGGKCRAARCPTAEIARLHRVSDHGHPPA
jgi:HrpA-like RNA helicase